MTESRSFPLDDILTITTGLWVGHGCNAVLEYIIKTRLYSDDFGRAVQICKPWIEELHPELREIRLPLMVVRTQDEISQWRAAVDEVLERYGRSRELRPLDLPAIDVLRLLLSGRERMR